MALEVVGAGLGRTGTLSLKLALEHLGFGPCFHMVEIMRHARERMPQWIGVVRGERDWDSIFAGYSATVDYPTCTYWRELADYYPQSKVILSDRDAGSWYGSIRETIMSPANVAGFLASPIAEFMLGAVIGDFVDHLDDRDWMIDYYDRRRAEIISALPSERLLVHRAAEGWEPLCAFLGVPVPAGPYPRVNSKADMQRHTQRDNSKGEGELPMDPAAMEERMEDYLQAMQKLAFG